MDEKGKETIAAFDRLLTTNRIQMMKVFLSYLPPEQQGGLAVYIKFSELKYTLQLMQRFPGRPVFMGQHTILSLNSLMDGSLLEQNQDGILELLDELLPFSGPTERNYIQNLKNILTSFSRMREMMAMMDMMKELFPEGMDSPGSFGNVFSGMAGGEDMTDMSGFSNLFSGGTGTDPTAILQMLQMIQSSQSDNAHKSDRSDNT